MRRRVKVITLVRSTSEEVNYKAVRKSHKRIKTIKKLSTRRENENQQGRNSFLHIDGSVR